MRVPRLPFFFFVLCGALAGAVPVVAQKAPAPAAPAQPDPSSMFGEVIDVRVVNVEAVVTDRAGNRVNDLRPGDFRLKVDGKEVPVAFFTEVRDGKSAAAGETAAAPAGPGGVGPGDAVGTSYLMFIDDYFSTAVQRNHVLEALKKDLARLGPADRMAVVAFDGARLARLSGWSGSAAELGRVLDQAMARPARGLDRAAELRSFLESASFSDQVLDQGPRDPLRDRVSNAGLSLQQRAYGGTLMVQVDAAVSAVVSAMRGAGAPRGRKVLLLLAGGWPFSVQSYLLGADPGTPSQELPSGEAMMRPLTSTANLLGFTIYPVDVPGIGTGAADASSIGAQREGSNLREQEIEGSLSFIAAETGGRALLNSGRDAAFTTVAADLRSYYWLGFTPTWERNDHRHKIEVNVLRPDLSVRARNSFLDLSPKAELSMKMESALLLGTLPDAVPMPMRLGTPVRSKGETEIPITLGLPVNGLTMAIVDGQYRAHVELRVAVVDENGNRSEVPVIPIDLASSKSPKPGGFVRYDTKLKLHGKASKARNLVVAVYDPMSTMIATAEADIPEAPAAAKP
jgi:VWFA-related protein